MFFAVFTGISIGLGLAISVGPYFMYLVNTSLNKGKISASYLALGVALNDLVFLTVAIFSVEFFIKNISLVNNAKGLAGIFVFCYGIYTIFKKVKLNSANNETLNPKEKLKNMVKGFLFNGFNPSVFIFWFATVGTLISKSTFTKSQTLVVFLSIVVTTLTCDMIKVRLAEFFSHYLNAKFIKRVNVIVGIILVLISFYLFYNTMKS